MSKSSQASPLAENKKRTAVVEDTLLLNALHKWGKWAAGVTAVWFMGHWGFSFVWLWIVLVLYVWKDRHRKAKQHRAAISQEIARDEKSVILARVEDLPSWVSFSDVERAEWVNKMIKQLWPYIGEYVDKILRGSVEPSVRDSLPASLKSFKFTTIDLGDIPPRVGGVKVYTGQRRDEMHMDLELNFSSDCDIAVSIKGISAGIKDFMLHGTLRVVFKPLINRSPLIGGMRVFFLNNPTVEFSLTSVASAFDLPGLSDMLQSIINEQISNLMVLPNCIPIKLADNIDVKKLRYPQPEGIVRIKVVEAKDLVEADISLIGKGTSDPYVVLKVGSREVRTSIKSKTLSPVWNETFEMVVDSADGQLLYIDLYDDDQGSKDDELGRVNMDLAQLKAAGFQDEWLPLEDVKSGMIHVELTWLWLANDPAELERVAPESIQTQGESNIHSAMLLVFLDSAMDLPAQRGKVCVQEPSPQATISVGQQVFDSKIKANTNEPIWEENFRFMLQNPAFQSLELEIKDTKTKRSIGKSQIKIKDLLSEEDMELDQKFPLKTSDPKSCVIMRVALRVLTPRSDPKWIEEVEDLLIDSSSDTPEKTPGKDSSSQGQDKKSDKTTKEGDSKKDGEDSSKVDDCTKPKDHQVNETEKKPEDTTPKPEDKTQTEEVKEKSPEENKEDRKETDEDEPETEKKKQDEEKKVAAETQKEDDGDASEGVLIETEEAKDIATLKVPEQFNPEADCEAVSKSMQVSGVDEAAIIDLLGHRSQDQRYQIATTYMKFHQQDLTKDLSGKLKGKLKNMCLELLQSQADLDAKALNKAMKGLGCNVEVMVEILFTRSNSQITKIKEAYNRLYNTYLDKEVANETKGELQYLFIRCLMADRPEGRQFDRNKARQDAKALMETKKGDWCKKDSVFMTILVSCSYSQLRTTFQEYARLAGKEVEADVQAETSGDLKSGVLTILQLIRGRAKYFARVLYKSMKGLGTDDDTLVRVVASRCEIDMVQIKEEFQKEYQQTLAMFIADDTSGDYRKLLLTMIGDDEDGDKK